MFCRVKLLPRIVVAIGRSLFMVEVGHESWDEIVRRALIAKELQPILEQDTVRWIMMVGIFVKHSI